MINDQYASDNKENPQPYCQAQPKPKSKLEAEMAIFSIVTTTHQDTHPPIRTSLNLALDNITTKSKVAYLFELGL